MRYKEYHYRVNPIKKQIDELRHTIDINIYTIYKQRCNLDDVTLQCANLRLEIEKLQNTLTNLSNIYVTSNYNKVINKEDKSE